MTRQILYILIDRMIQNTRMTAKHCRIFHIPGVCSLIVHYVYSTIFAAVDSLKLVMNVGHFVSLGCIGRMLQNGRYRG